MNGPERSHPGLVRSRVTAASHFCGKMSREPGGGGSPYRPPPFTCKLLNLCTITYDITFQENPLYTVYIIHVL